MPVFNNADLEADVKSRMIAFMDTYLQLKKVVQRAHKAGTFGALSDAELTEIRNITQDMEFLFANNGSDPGRTNADRRAILERYGVVDILS